MAEKAFLGRGGIEEKRNAAATKPSPLSSSPLPRKSALILHAQGKRRERERETAAGLPSFLLPPPHFLCLVSSRRSGGQQGACTACGVGEPRIAVFMPPQSAKTGCSQKPCTG